MINHIRTLITQSYDLLNNNPDFAFIRNAGVNATIISDDFLKLTKELADLKWQFREALHNLSTVVEEMDGVIGDIKLVIKRENMKKKSKKEGSKQL
jgi:hypothetical protein